MVQHCGFAFLDAANRTGLSTWVCRLRCTGSKVLLPDALFPKGRRRTQAAPLFHGSSSMVLVCIWLSGPISSCFPLCCCSVQHLSPIIAPAGLGSISLPSIMRNGLQKARRVDHSAGAHRSTCWRSSPGCSHPTEERGTGGRVIAAVTHQLLSPNKRQRLHSPQKA